MPTVTVLVGLPACGKSTWREKNLDAFDWIYSTDDLVEEYALAQGKTYGDVWKSYIGEATKLANSRLQNAIRDGQNIVADRTNLTVAARAKFLAQFPKSYIKKVVFFAPPDHLGDLVKRVNSRVGKDIPFSVLKGMRNTLEVPTTDEGFSSVDVVDTWVGN